MSRLLFVPRRRARLTPAWVGALACLALLVSWYVLVPRTGDAATIMLRFLANAVVTFGVLLGLSAALRRRAPSSRRLP